jgi:excinuclease ABC subunit B
VAILDADKEGFLRSSVSLIQTIGRAARNVAGQVIMYADKVTASMKKAIDETDRRRIRQGEYNAEHGITPTSVKKAILDLSISAPYAVDAHYGGAAIAAEGDETPLTREEIQTLLQDCGKKMRDAAEELDFEAAAKLRDELLVLKDMDLGLKPPLRSLLSAKSQEGESAPPARFRNRVPSRRNRPRK